MSPAPRPEWIVPQWQAPKRVRALVTTRAGGTSTGPYASLNLGTRVGDDPACVARNRAVLQGCLPSEPKWLKQVHGTRVIRAEDTEDEVEADAAVTASANVVCAVLVADCLPVLLCDRDGSVVAAAHAGWRGLCAGVLEAVVNAMDVSPGRISAYLGPGIGPQAYEVGADVRDAFLRRDPAASAAFTPRPGDKFSADLGMLARQRLAACGVTRVFGGDMCTSRDRRFFSFRRDGITGRMAGLVWMEKN